MRIRNAKECDYLEVLNLLKEIHKIHFNARRDVYNEGSNLLSKEDYIKELNDETMKRIVVVVDEKVIGYALGRVINIYENSVVKATKYMYIEEICVSSNYRKNGFGKILFNELEKISILEKCKSIQLNVWNFNEDAKCFYEKLGFKVRNIRLEKELL